MADRMFHSMKKAWESASRENMSDVRELTPEFFYLPEFLTNCNAVEFGEWSRGEAAGAGQLVGHEISVFAEQLNTQALARPIRWADCREASTGWRHLTRRWELRKDTAPGLQDHQATVLPTTSCRESPGLSAVRQRAGVRSPY